MLASGLHTNLIRLQCYEGLDVSHAVYEWNYARQLLEIRLMEASGSLERARATKELFSDEFLIKRPLLQALASNGAQPPVLLIDELDRADEEFEGFLLELLSDFQITIPEIGTIRAERPPTVVITSNRTRELHDALKRRCLYYWIDYPDYDKELEIVLAKVPEAATRLARAGHRVRAGAAHNRAVQDGWDLRNARLGGRAGGPEPTGARPGHDRADAGRHPEEPRGPPGHARRTGAGAAESSQRLTTRETDIRLEPIS